jgi:DNA-binding CsgD family transcriptional regulator
MEHGSIRAPRRASSFAVRGSVFPAIYTSSVPAARAPTIARVQGQRWRSEARSLLNGLGQAIDAQFSRWNLTEAERKVALLLLKGLSTKEIAAVRASSEWTVREQARSIYSKAGLTGRAALSAFFLEDLLAPIEGLKGLESAE